MMKIPKNWLTHLILATPQALTYGLFGSVSLQNTTIASNTILDTPHNTQQVEKMVSKSFKLQIWAKIDNFCIFSWLRLRVFQFFCDLRKNGWV